MWLKSEGVSSHLPLLSLYNFEILLGTIYHTII
jgi:hypothetical protein